MTEIEYLILQCLINLDTNRPRTEIIKDVKKFLDDERVAYDKDLLSVYVDFGLRKLDK